MTLFLLLFNVLKLSLRSTRFIIYLFRNFHTGDPVTRPLRPPIDQEFRNQLRINATLAERFSECQQYLQAMRIWTATESFFPLQRPMKANNSFSMINDRFTCRILLSLDNTTQLCSNGRRPVIEDYSLTISYALLQTTGIVTLTALFYQRDANRFDHRLH